MEKEDEEKKFDWGKYVGTVSLPKLYANARCLKEAVYRKWIEQLSAFLFERDEAKRNEAIRRIEYIEQHLLGGATANTHQ